MNNKPKRINKRMRAILLAASLYLVPVSVAHADGGIIIEDDADIVKVTQTQVEGLVELTRLYGYRCDSVSSAYPRSSGTFSLKCNNHRYAYIIEDVGGNYIVFVR